MPSFGFHRKISNGKTGIKAAKALTTKSWKISVRQTEGGKIKHPIAKPSLAQKHWLKTGPAINLKAVTENHDH